MSRALVPTHSHESRGMPGATLKLHGFIPVAVSLAGEPLCLETKSLSVAGGGRSSSLRTCNRCPPAKQSFEDIGIPKLELGNEGAEHPLTPTSD